MSLRTSAPAERETEAAFSQRRSERRGRYATCMTRAKFRPTSSVAAFTREQHRKFLSRLYRDKNGESQIAFL
jgi:hypothetical protein